VDVNLTIEEKSALDLATDWKEKEIDQDRINVNK